MIRTLTIYEADVPNKCIKKITRQQVFDAEGTAGWVTQERNVTLVNNPTAERARLDEERISYSSMRADRVDWIAELDAAIAALGT